MKRVQGFVAGLLTAAVIMAYGVTAFAAGNGWNITVYPIKVLVNGEVLQPTDASGNPMEVFTCNGTTYAPLRALAEAYGLEVGYDSQRNIAMARSLHVAGSWIFIYLFHHPSLPLPKFPILKNPVCICF